MHKSVIDLDYLKIIYKCNIEYLSGDQKILMIQIKAHVPA